MDQIDALGLTPLKIGQMEEMGADAIPVPRPRRLSLIQAYRKAIKHTGNVCVNRDVMKILKCCRRNSDVNKPESQN